MKYGSETKDNEMWNIIWNIVFPNSPSSDVMTINHDITFGFLVFI